jgi:hypothetical protein
VTAWRAGLSVEQLHAVDGQEHRHRVPPDGNAPTDQGPTSKVPEVCGPQPPSTGGPNRPVRPVSPRPACPPTCPRPTGHHAPGHPPPAATGTPDRPPPRHDRPHTPHPRHDVRARPTNPPHQCITSRRTTTAVRTAVQNTPRHSQRAGAQHTSCTPHGAGSTGVRRGVVGTLAAAAGTPCPAAQTPCPQHRFCRSWATPQARPQTTPQASRWATRWAIP